MTKKEIIADLENRIASKRTDLLLALTDGNNKDLIRFLKEDIEHKVWKLKQIKNKK